MSQPSLYEALKELQDPKTFLDGAFNEISETMKKEGLPLTGDEQHILTSVLNELGGSLSLDRSKTAIVEFETGKMRALTDEEFANYQRRRESFLRVALSQLSFAGDDRELALKRAVYATVEARVQRVQNALTLFLGNTLRAALLGAAGA